MYKNNQFKYFIDSEGRIRADNCNLPVETAWRDLDNFEDALEEAGARSLEFSVNCAYRRSLKLKIHIASDNLDVDEGMFLLTDVNCRVAAIVFEWSGCRYFSIRPDFGALSIKSNLCEQGVNKFEWIIRGEMIKYHQQFSVLFNEIRSGTLTFTGGHNFLWWCKFWKSKNFDLKPGWPVPYAIYPGRADRSRNIPTLEVDGNSTPILSVAEESDGDEDVKIEKRKPGASLRNDWALIAAIAGIICHREAGSQEIASNAGKATRLNDILVASGYTCIGYTPAPSRTSLNEHKIFDHVLNAIELYNKGCRKYPPRLPRPL